jgi:hypothetical protein
MKSIEIEVIDTDGYFIEAGCITKSDPLGGPEVVKKNSPDKYKEILGNGKATVEIPYIETIGGPGYSSVKVGLVVRVHCDQNSETVRAVADMLIKDAIQTVDDHVDWGYKVLLSHVERLQGDG